MDLTNEMSSREDEDMEENMKSEESALAAFDFSAEEVDTTIEQLAEQVSRGKPICMCGHPEGRHEWLEPSFICNANKQNCKCLKKNLVIEADYARLFLRKTSGPGPLHALAQGIRESEKAGHEVKWIVPVACDRCKAAGPVSPCPVNERGSIMYEDTGRNVLLCNDCRLNNG